MSLDDIQVRIDVEHIRIGVETDAVEVITSDPPVDLEIDISPKVHVIVSPNMGTPGPPGPPGQRGSVWYSGTIPPDSSLGVVGDWYLNVTTGDVSEKVGSYSWTVRGNLMGPSGGGSALYGRFAIPIILGKSISGQKKTFAQSVIPVVFGKAIAGKKTTFGQVARATTFIKDIQGSSTSPTSDSYGMDIYGDGNYGDTPYTTYLGQTNLPITFGKAIAGDIPVPKTTPVAEISLASHVAPASRTQHSIKVRARTTGGSGGLMKAALYEGATNRSGDLTSSVLTNTLADYTLAIPDAGAAAISSYSNLSIKIWGSDPGRTGLVFEVSKLYLELPSS